MSQNIAALRHSRMAATPTTAQAGGTFIRPTAFGTPPASASASQSSGGLLKTLVRPRSLMLLLIIYAVFFLWTHHANHTSVYSSSSSKRPTSSSRGNDEKLQSYLQDLWSQEVDGRAEADDAHLGISDPKTPAPRRRFTINTSSSSSSADAVSSPNGGTAANGAAVIAGIGTSGSPVSLAGACVAVVTVVRDNDFPHAQVAALQVAEMRSGAALLIVVLLHDKFPSRKLDELIALYKEDETIRIVHSKTSVMHFAASLNEAVSVHIPAQCPFVLFLTRHHFPTNPSSFIDDMLRTFGAPIPAQRGLAADGKAHGSTEFVKEIGVVGCTTLTNSSNGTLIADKGSEVGLGVHSTLHRLFMVRRHVGLPQNDKRARLDVEPVDFVSPYCMMVSRRAFAAVGGFIGRDKVASRGAIEKLEGFTNDGDTSRLSNLVFEILSFRLQFLDRAISKIKISEVSAGTPDFRKQIMKAISTDTAAIQLMEVHSGGSWAVGSAAKLPPEIADRERRKMKDIMTMERSAMVVALRNLVEEAMTLAVDFGRSSIALVPEESVGWDFSLRARQKNFGVVVSNASAVLRSMRISENEVAALFRAGDVYPANYPLMGGFLEKWGTEVAELHHSSRVRTARIVVLWYAYCCMCCGFVNEIVSLVAYLQKLQEVTLIPDIECFCPLSIGNEEMVRRLHVNPRKVRRTHPDDVVVWISHTDPSMYGDIHILGQDRIDYFVGRSMYEFSRISQFHVDDANKKSDEVWVPAQFVKRLFIDSGVNADKIVVIPEAVDIHQFDPEIVAKVPLPPAPQRWHHWCNRAPATPSFKYFSDFKWEPRKGWDVLFEAYFRAFEPDDNTTTLYVLSHIWFPGSPDTYGWKHNITAIREAINNHVSQLPDGAISHDESQRPAYCIISESLSPKSLTELYNSVDAFVLPTRGEGWGLPAIQAMAMGKPTISTNWGGNTEFMTQSNSFLIPLDGLDEIDPGSVYGWAMGKKWAVPSMRGLVDILQYLPKHQDLARRVGQRARKSVVMNFSEEVVARTIDRQLDAIRSKVVHARVHGGKPIPTDPKPIEDFRKMNNNKRRT